MVSQKIVWVMIVIALVLLSFSIFIMLSFSEKPVYENTNEQGNQQGNLNLVINPPANISAAGNISRAG